MSEGLVRPLFHDDHTKAETACSTGSKKPCQIMHITSQLKAENRVPEIDDDQIYAYVTLNFNQEVSIVYLFQSIIIFTITKLPVFSKFKVTILPMISAQSIQPLANRHSITSEG